MTLTEIKENNLRCVIKVDSKEEAVKLFEIFNPDWYDANYAYNYLMGDYRKRDGTVCFSVAGNKIDGFDTETYFKKNEERYGKIYRFKDLIAKEGIVGTFKGTPVYATGGVVSIHDLSTSEWYKHFTVVKKEEKKMPTKFTFYFNVNEGTRVDKSCNGTIPTITTSVVLDKFGDPDRRKCYSLKGEATCDKADYDMRQGVLEALANAVFDGNFKKAYDKAVKTNAFCERQDRTCHYCGKVLDTIAEKQAHEAWHVECKKARRERYLLRKRAKEIAFEEQAQKMAKEMIKK